VVLMEAMASGVPVVASGISGIPELVEDGVSGLLVPPKDPAALALAIERIADDPRLALALSAGGRARVEAEFDLERNAARLLATIGAA
jgi:glycosyltransferase involved in cell wall biosynthesis